MRSATKASRKAVLLIVLFGVALGVGSAATAKAVCSWILWSRNIRLPAGIEERDDIVRLIRERLASGATIEQIREAHGPWTRHATSDGWKIGDAFESKQECSKELADPGRLTSIIVGDEYFRLFDYKCFPDTIDLRDRGFLERLFDAPLGKR